MRHFLTGASEMWWNGAIVGAANGAVDQVGDVGGIGGDGAGWGCASGEARWRRVKRRER
ncbi:MAG: hypothetical protein M3457_01305 [Chloroflexota bacterium]|nr:hypothetical protein [Chloroflexota bacterium]